MKKALTVLSLAILSQSSFAANDDIIEKTCKFHYGNYSASQHTNEVAVENWNSKTGMERFNRTDIKGDFFRLAHHFKPQRDFSSCGQATATIVLAGIYELNKKPFPIIEEMPFTMGDKTYGYEYRSLNENNFYNESTDKVLDRRAVARKIQVNGHFMGGIDIEQLQKMLNIHGVKSKLVNVKSATDKDIEGFRKIVKEVVNSEKSFLILNYDHSYKNLMGGHFSPVVAFDEKSDSVMMLDVAEHKNPWIWINVKDLYNSMNTKNYSQTSTRGYLIVDTKIG